MKVLVAVMTCDMMKDRANAVRSTWGAECAAHGLDLRFFVGRSKTTTWPDDTVVLDCGDSYQELPVKVQAARRWAYDRGYDWVVKCDDDVYVRPERLLATVPTDGVHYAGRVRGPSGLKPAPYASGFCYWLDRHALELLLEIPWDHDIAEDRWTGNELLKRGVVAVPDYRHVVCRSVKNSISAKEPPRCDNDYISGAEFSPAEMCQVHQEFHLGKPALPKPLLPVGPLSRVTVLVKTFLRDGYLFACLRGLEKTMPEARIVVVDDGYSSKDKVTRYSELIGLGHTCLWLPYDSGFGAKANVGVSHAKTEYVLIGSDDFDFENPIARAGVEKLVRVLDARPEIGVASGRVNDRNYESLLEFEGQTVREVKGTRFSDQLQDGTTFSYCDLTVNYSLIRRRVFDTVRWDDDVKIGGGEHGAFFVDVLRAGWKTCVVDGVNIFEYPYAVNWQHPDYKAMRNRARQPGRPCLKRRGVDRWICQDGREEVA